MTRWEAQQACQSREGGQQQVWVPCFIVLLTPPSDITWPDLRLEEKSWAPDICVLWPVWFMKAYAVLWPDQRLRSKAATSTFMSRNWFTWNWGPAKPEDLNSVRKSSLRDLSWTLIHIYGNQKSYSDLVQFLNHVPYLWDKYKLLRCPLMSLGIVHTEQCANEFKVNWMSS